MMDDGWRLAGSKLSFDEQDKLRRKCRRSIMDSVIKVQTYRAYVVFECGHTDTFTLSAEAYAKNAWRKRRRTCSVCSQELIAKIEKRIADALS